MRPIFFGATRNDQGYAVQILYPSSRDEREHLVAEIPLGGDFDSIQEATERAIDVFHSLTPADLRRLKSTTKPLDRARMRLDELLYEIDKQL